jgi:glucokinase
VYGKPGSWEGYSSGAGIAALARERFPNHFRADVTAQQVVQRARDGDEAALSVIDESARQLGAGIALLIDLLNPQVVVLGSLAVRAGDLFLPVVDHVLRKECTPRAYAACRVLPAALGTSLGDVAAVCAAVYRMRGRETT